MSYVFTFWTFFVLYHEYKVVTTMRLRFLANQNRRPDQYTVNVLSLHFFGKCVSFTIFIC
jgi:calcium permeable stress-gated cation channel